MNDVFKSTGKDEMSQQGASATQAFYRRIEVLVFLLASPVVISFFVSYLVPVVGFGAAVHAPITFGLAAACTDSTRTVAYLWSVGGTISDGVCTGTASSDPSMPVVLLNILEGSIVTIDLILVAIEAIRMVPAITQMRQEQ